MSTNNSLFFLGLILTIFLIPTSYSLSFADQGEITVHSFDVAYDIENGVVESMYLDPDFIELVITMDTSSDGTFQITIPRALLDAKFEASDDIFFILVDGFETDYLEIETSSTSRTIVIPFFGGDSIIDIIGTTTLNPFIEDPEIEIPSWIKSNAEWWASDQIDDETFVQGIQYLITNGIMTV